MTMKVLPPRRPKFCIATTVASLAAVVMSSPISAYTNPVVVAQGQLLRSMNEGYADRANGRSARSTSSRARVATSCTEYLPVYRQRYGARHPQVVKLTALCRRAGF